MLATPRFTLRIINFLAYVANRMFFCGFHFLAAYPIAINENGVTSTFGIEDGSYLRLNTVTLGYSLSKQLMKKIGISSLRIYGSIYNVFTLTKYSGLDPEVSTNDKANNSFYPTPGMDFGAYPRARSFVAGLNLSF